MGRRGRLILSAGIAALAFVVVGCGGDDSGGDTTQGTPLSKTDFIAQANAICADGEQDLDRAARERFGNSRPTEAQISAFAEQELIPVLEQEANSIDQLGPPGEDIEAVDAIVAALRGGIESLRSDPAALADGSSAALDEANRLANEYGLTVCGRRG